MWEYIHPKITYFELTRASNTTITASSTILRIHLKFENV